MRNAEVLKPGKRTDRRRDQIIGDKQKSADDGDDLGAMPHARVNAAAIRIKAADDHVVDADERSENAHCGDQPERGVTGHGKGEADDVSFARAPIAVQDGGRARRVDIARTLDVAWYQFLRLKRGDARATRRLTLAEPVP